MSMTVVLLTFWDGCSVTAWGRNVNSCAKLIVALQAGALASVVTSRCSVCVHFLHLHRWEFCMCVRSAAEGFGCVHV